MIPEHFIIIDVVFVVVVVVVVVVVSTCRIISEVWSKHTSVFNGSYIHPHHLSTIYC